MPVEDVYVDGVAVNKAAVRVFFSDPDFDTLIVGDDAGGTGAVVPSPIKFVGAQATIQMVTTDTGGTAETAISNFLKNASGDYQKYGVIAFTRYDSSVTDGGGAVNVHAKKYVAGVASDDYIWVGMGGNGFRVFPNTVGIADAPGDKIMAVNGDFAIAGTFSITTPNLLTFITTNLQHTGIQQRNTHTGVSASERFILGNNTTAAGFTVEYFGGGHATKPSHAEIYQQLNAPLAFGTNALERMVIAAGGGVKINSLAGSGTRNVVVDANGNLSAP